MSAKAILSSKGQLVIPKKLRIKLGLHSGSEIAMSLSANNVLELTPVKKEVNNFFGMGKSKKKAPTMSIKDIDKAIAKAVTDNDRY